MYPGVHAASTPDKPALIMGSSGEVVTYAELDQRSNQLAHLFRNAGLTRGDHVALFIAESEAIAARACGLIHIEWEQRPLLTDVREAMKDERILHPGTAAISSSTT